MARMIRKQIYLLPRQNRALKDMVHEAGISEAEFIREAIDRRLAGIGLKQDPAAWEDERRFIENLMRKPSPRETSGRAWKRRDLYDR